MKLANILMTTLATGALTAPVVLPKSPDTKQNEHRIASCIPVASGPQDDTMDLHCVVAIPASGPDVPGQIWKRASNWRTTDTRPLAAANDTAVESVALASTVGMHLHVTINVASDWTFGHELDNATIEAKVTDTPEVGQAEQNRAGFDGLPDVLTGIDASKVAISWVYPEGDDPYGRLMQCSEDEFEHKPIHPDCEKLKKWSDDNLREDMKAWRALHDQSANGKSE